MNKPKSIKRSKHDPENPYFMMRRDTAQDETLSWEARGILCYLLSKPDDWEIQIDDLQQHCGKNQVYRIIAELKKARYIEDRTRKQKPDGTWHWTPYILHEQPYPQNHDMETMTWKPYHGNDDINNKVETQKKEKEKDSAQGAILEMPSITLDDIVSSNGHTTPEQPSQKGKRGKSKVSAEQEDDPTTKQARQLIFTYQSYAKDKDRSLHGKGLAAAKDLIKAGITLDNVRDWFHEKSQEQWVRENLNGIPTWNMLAKGIIAWRDSQNANDTSTTNTQTRDIREIFKGRYLPTNTGE